MIRLLMISFPHFEKKIAVWETGDLGFVRWYAVLLVVSRHRRSHHLLEASCGPGCGSATPPRRPPPPRAAGCWRGCGPPPSTGRIRPAQGSIPNRRGRTSAAPPHRRRGKARRGGPSPPRCKWQPPPSFCTCSGSLRPLPPTRKPRTAGRWPRRRISPSRSDQSRPEPARTPSPVFVFVPRNAVAFVTPTANLLFVVVFGVLFRQRFEVLCRVEPDSFAMRTLS